ncbi:MAG: hypothetical protein ACRBCT_02590 [Alphaproteobacteria bacterium]
MIKKHSLFLAALMLCGGILAASLPLRANTPDITITQFSGFKPDTNIHYQIFDGKSLIHEGEKRVSKNGDLALAAPDFKDNTDTDLTYDFKIHNEAAKAPLHLRLHLDRNAAIFKARGSGLNEFGAVTLKTPQTIQQTKTDWAGIFEQDLAMPANTNNAQEIQIALNGAAAFSFVNNNQGSGIIKVLTAPGGGGPSTAGVNSFSPSPSPLSTSVTSHVNNTIDLLKENYLTAMMLMTEQLSAVAMHQTFAVGTFFDAKQQLEAERSHQRLKAQAVKDYHPSTEMCRIGSYMRSIAHTEQKAEADTRMLGERLLNLYTGEAGTAASINGGSYMAGRLQQFRTVYCDPRDNNDGLALMCDHDGVTGGDAGAQNQLRINKDIDTAITLETPKTLDIDFTDDTLSDDEEDIMALAANLYWPTALEWPTDDGKMLKKEGAMKSARRLIALNTIAHNSLTNIAGLKSASLPPTGGIEPGWMFMKSFVKEFGLSEADIDQWLGERPSYWAQMDVLTKKMVQHPNFYTNLYDKPVNVERMSVALEAISLMQMRDHYDSKLREELIKSAMIETELERDFNAAKSLLRAQ